MSIFGLFGGDDNKEPDYKGWILDDGTVAKDHGIDSRAGFDAYNVAFKAKKRSDAEELAKAASEAAANRAKQISNVQNNYGRQATILTPAVAPANKTVLG